MVLSTIIGRRNPKKSNTSIFDLMSIGHKIDPRGAIFSHECEAKNFVGGTIVAAPDSVIPPILDHFKKLGTQPTGRSLAGNTGTFLA
jgi:hypothetical protein